MASISRNPLSHGISSALTIRFAAALLLPNIAVAQQSDYNDSVPKQLDTITVSAQKREERLQDVPMSVQVLSAENLSSEGNFKLADYFSKLPGLSYIQSPMTSNIVLRGIATSSGIGVRPTAGVVIDDVPYGSAVNTSAIPDLDPADLRQIEVLRGPQGTLYGASSMGGLVKYVLSEPETGPLFGRVEIGGADALHGGSGYNSRASVNLPLSDSFALRASIFQREDPYFIKNIRSDEKNKAQVRGGRVAALWNIADNVKINASVLFQDTETDADTTVDTDVLLNPIFGQYAHDRITNGDTFDGQMRMYTAKLAWDLGWASLDSISGYAQHRSSAYQDVGYSSIGSNAPRFASTYGLSSNNPSALVDNRYDINRLTHELRFSSQGSNLLDWQIGAFYSRQDISSTQNFLIADKNSGQIFHDYPLLIALGDTEFLERAIYGDVTYHFTTQFDVQVGARYARNELRETYRVGGLLQGEATTPSGTDDSVGTYLFSPRYKINNSLMAYARVASGYRAGGSNSNLVSTVPRAYESDKLWSYELGLKTQLLDRTLSLETSAFYIDWSDLQLAQTEPTLGVSYTTNAGKSVSQGLELSASWIPSSDWTVTASYAYTDAKLTEDIPGFTEGTVAYGKDGDRLPYTAQNSAALSAKRYFSLPAGLDGFVAADAAYTGSRMMEFTNSATLARVELPAFTTVGLNLGVLARTWSATLYVRNLTDEVGYLNSTRRGARTNRVSSYLIQPRTFGITLAWNY